MKRASSNLTKIFTFIILFLFSTGNIYASDESILSIAIKQNKKIIDARKNSNAEEARNSIYDILVYSDAIFFSKCFYFSDNNYSTECIKTESGESLVVRELHKRQALNPRPRLMSRTKKTIVSGVENGQYFEWVRVFEENGHKNGFNPQIGIIKNFIKKVFGSKGVGSGKNKKHSKVAHASDKQIQAKFKHAKDFGVYGNYNKINAQKFYLAIQKHLNDNNTVTFKGTYRGIKVIFHTNPMTGLTVITRTNGSFLSGWKLNPKQLKHIIKHQKL